MERKSKAMINFLFLPVILKEVITCTMTAEIKYTPRFLKLNANSSLEESKLAYDEMAPCWEKVNIQGIFQETAWSSGKGRAVTWLGQGQLRGHVVRGLGQCREAALSSARQRGTSLVLMICWGLFQF